MTDCISIINNAKGDNATDIDIVTLMHNLIGYSDNIKKYENVYGNIIEMG